MLFHILDRLVPALIIFMLLRGILSVLLGKKKRKKKKIPREDLPQPSDGDGTGENGNYNAEQNPTQAQPDLAAEFERRLREKKKKKQAEQQKIYVDKAAAAKEERVNPERGDKQRVHYDEEKQHEGKGRIHRDGENLQHDKSKLYRDPRGDYSYDEEKFNLEAAAFSARLARPQEMLKPKAKMKHAALVNGFIMAQLLAKPRAEQPYGCEENYF